MEHLRCNSIGKEDTDMTEIHGSMYVYMPYAPDSMFFAKCFYFIVSLKTLDKEVRYFLVCRDVWHLTTAVYDRHIPSFLGGYSWKLKNYHKDEEKTVCYRKDQEKTVCCSYQTAKM